MLVNPSRRFLMKLHSLRRPVLAVVPIVLAAGTLGLTAGSASAMPRQCGPIIDQVYYDWAEADFNTQYAAEANAAGDYLAVAYYSYQAAKYETEGDNLYNQAQAMGC
jgi:hypothetical protein